MLRSKMMPRLGNKGVYWKFMTKGDYTVVKLYKFYEKWEEGADNSNISAS